MPKKEKKRFLKKSLWVEKAYYNIFYEAIKVNKINKFKIYIYKKPILHSKSCIKAIN